MYVCVHACVYICTHMEESEDVNVVLGDRFSCSRSRELAEGGVCIYQNRIYVFVRLDIKICMYIYTYVLIYVHTHVYCFPVHVLIQISK